MKPDQLATSAATISRTTPLAACHALFPLPPSLLLSVHLPLPPSVPLPLIKIQCSSNAPMQKGIETEKKKHLPVSLPTKPATDAPLQKMYIQWRAFALQISHITNRRAGDGFLSSFLFVLFSSRMLHRRCAYLGYLRPFCLGAQCIVRVVICMLLQCGNVASCICYGWQVFKRNGYSGWEDKQSDIPSGGQGESRETEIT